MSISEDTFASWAQGPGTVEAQKCANAETAIRKAILADATLAQMDITVFTQGSYAVRTNVRLDSDVDICIRYNEAFFTQYPDGMTDADFGNVNGGLAFSDFKGPVQRALESYFDSSSVTRGSKAFDIHANTYRIDADVVPAFGYRYYTGRKDLRGNHEILHGVAFIPDTGVRIVNWPQQTYDNGVMRNDQTGRKYKRIIRILKRLRNRMQDDGIVAAQNISSFLIECLVWNAPLEAFQHEKYTENVRHVLAHTCNNTREDKDCSEWREVNEIKYLFRSFQPWTRYQANQFLNAAWDYIGFK
ncbi:MAG: nucleotidyltransferase [Deltaproteobacteria bacterium]|nr:nucleotidyltransferase [Deltaproteobacteria bacterium]